MSLRRCSEEGKVPLSAKDIKNLAIELDKLYGSRLQRVEQEVFGATGTNGLSGTAKKHTEEIETNKENVRSAMTYLKIAVALQVPLIVGMVAAMWRIFSKT